MKNQGSWSCIFFITLVFPVQVHCCAAVTERPARCISEFTVVPPLPILPRVSGLQGPSISLSPSKFSEALVQAKIFELLGLKGKGPVSHRRE